MPKWIWQLSPKILTYKEKHILSFIWWYGENGCREWNWRIMRRFKCSRATIKRRLKKLHDLKLIYINFPHSKHRQIIRKPYFNIKVWYEHRPCEDFSGKPVSSAAANTQGGSKVSHISNAQHKDS